MLMVGMLCLGERASARAGSIQLFSTVGRQAVNVGEPFALDVSVYATLSNELAVHRLEAALRDAELSPLPPDLKLVRREAIQRRTRQVVGGKRPVVILSQRLLFRAEETGLVEGPSLQFSYRGRQYRTEGFRVDAYAAQQSFYRTRHSIFPVVARHVEGRQVYRQTGSSFLIAPDAVVTSFHVVLDAEEVRIRLPDGTRITTRKAWALDPARDVAVLFVPPEKTKQAGLTPLQLAPALKGASTWKQQVERHQVVFTNGWPGGAQRSTAGRRYHYDLPPSGARWITANPVRPGDSGGPLLDAQGRVLGVVQSGTARQMQAMVLQEELCIATDPRPVIGRAMLASTPRSFSALLEDQEPTRQSHVAVIRVEAELRREREDALPEQLDQLPRREQLGLLYRLGTIYQRMETPQKAMEAYRKALDRFDAHFPAAFSLGQHHLSKGEYGQAKQYFAQVYQSPPYMHLAAYGLARVHMAQRNVERARSYLREVVRFDAHFAPAWYDMARCFLMVGKEEEARQLLPKLEEVSPDWAEQLWKMLRYPALRPVVVQPVARVPLPAPSLRPSSVALR